MKCPNCKQKFDESKEFCQHCNLKKTDLKLVTVLKTSNPMTISFAKSILQDSKIKFITKGESIRAVYPLTNLGTVEFLVMKKDESEAKNILKEINETS
ncbi:DUF2007 domain-containing protein [Proteinivorax tanatarense]|uniref:DUF2007 domain-containing protein n=1 Tax=Proteinivorax tanatarense TaxID=1260629 RepID=A0AAU7VNW0_9FIRM